MDDDYDVDDPSQWEHADPRAHVVLWQVVISQGGVDTTANQQKNSTPAPPAYGGGPGVSPPPQQQSPETTSAAGTAQGESGPRENGGAVPGQDRGLLGLNGSGQVQSSFDMEFKPRKDRYHIVSSLGQPSQGQQQVSALEVGDMLIAVNGTPIRGLKRSKIAALVCGAPLVLTLGAEFKEGGGYTQVHTLVDGETVPVRRLMGTCKSMEPSEGLVTPRTGARRTLGIPSPQSEGTTSIDYASLRTPRACPSPQSEGTTEIDYTSLGTPRAYNLSRPSPTHTSGLRSALNGAINSSPQSSPNYPMSPCSSSSSPNARHLPAAPGMQTSSPAYPMSPSSSSSPLPHARHMPAAPGMQTPKAGMASPNNQAASSPPHAVPGGDARREEEEENHRPVSPSYITPKAQADVENPVVNAGSGAGNVTPRGGGGKKIFGSFRKAIKGAFGRRRSKQISIPQEDAN